MGCCTSKNVAASPEQPLSSYDIMLKNERESRHYEWTQNFKNTLTRTAIRKTPLDIVDYDARHKTTAHVISTVEVFVDEEISETRIQADKLQPSQIAFNLRSLPTQVAYTGHRPIANGLGHPSSLPLGQEPLDPAVRNNVHTRARRNSVDVLYSQEQIHADYMAQATALLASGVRDPYLTDHVPEWQRWGGIDFNALKTRRMLERGRVLASNTHVLSQALGELDANACARVLPSMGVCGLAASTIETQEMRYGPGPSMGAWPEDPTGRGVVVPRGVFTATGAWSRNRANSDTLLYEPPPPMLQACVTSTEAYALMEALAMEEGGVVAMHVAVDMEECLQRQREYEKNAGCAHETPFDVQYGIESNGHKLCDPARGVISSTNLQKQSLGPLYMRSQALDVGEVCVERLKLLNRRAIMIGASDVLDEDMLRASRGGVDPMYIDSLRSKGNTLHGDVSVDSDSDSDSEDDHQSLSSVSAHARTPSRRTLTTPSRMRQHTRPLSTSAHASTTSTPTAASAFPHSGSMRDQHRMQAATRGDHGPEERDLLSDDHLAELDDEEAYLASVSPTSLDSRSEESRSDIGARRTHSLSRIPVTRLSARAPSPSRNTPVTPATATAAAGGHSSPLPLVDYGTAVKDRYVPENAAVLKSFRRMNNHDEVDRLTAEARYRRASASSLDVCDFAVDSDAEAEEKEEKHLGAVLEACIDEDGRPRSRISSLLAGRRRQQQLAADNSDASVSVSSLAEPLPSPTSTTTGSRARHPSADPNTLSRSGKLASSLTPTSDNTSTTTAMNKSGKHTATSTSTMESISTAKGDRYGTDAANTAAHKASGSVELIYDPASAFADDNSGMGVGMAARRRGRSAASVRSSASAHGRKSVLEGDGTGMGYHSDVEIDVDGDVATHDGTSTGAAADGIGAGIVADSVGDVMSDGLPSPSGKSKNHQQKFAGLVFDGPNAQALMRNRDRHETKMSARQDGTGMGTSVHVGMGSAKGGGMGKALGRYGASKREDEDSFLDARAGGAMTPRGGYSRESNVRESNGYRGGVPSRSSGMASTPRNGGTGMTPRNGMGTQLRNNASNDSMGMNTGSARRGGVPLSAHDDDWLTGDYSHMNRDADTPTASYHTDSDSSTYRGVNPNHGAYTARNNTQRPSQARGARNPGHSRSMSSQRPATDRSHYSAVNNSSILGLNFDGDDSYGETDDRDRSGRYFHLQRKGAAVTPRSQPFLPNNSDQSLSLPSYSTIRPPGNARNKGGVVVAGTALLVSGRGDYDDDEPEEPPHDGSSFNLEGRYYVPDTLPPEPAFKQQKNLRKGNSNNSFTMAK